MAPDADGTAVGAGDGSRDGLDGTAVGSKVGMLRNMLAKFV